MTNHSTKNRRGKNRRGMSLIETALVLPVLLGLTLGMIEFGWAMFVSHAVQGAARTGARAGIVAGGTQRRREPGGRARAMGAGGFPTPATTTVSVTDGEGRPLERRGRRPRRRRSVVRRSRSTGTDAKPGIEVWGKMIGTLHGQTVMRKEG